MSLIHRCQQGFTTVTLMGVLSVGGLLVAGSFAAVDPDISLSREDQDHKQAYGAAEAGLQWYLNSLNRDNNYYVKCTPPNLPLINGKNPPVNAAWDGSGTDPRIWRNLPGEEAQYTIELLPAPGFASCQFNNQYSMVDPNGNMRIRSTGRSRGETRTVVASLRRRNFIDFIYFTDFEALDPEADGDDDTDENDCARYRTSRIGRGCTEIRFIGGDQQKGPVHTNDNFLICGTPTFGRTPRDAVESNGSTAFVDNCSGSKANVLGTLDHPAGSLGMPPSNINIATLAGATFKGLTFIVLKDTKMDVTTYDSEGKAVVQTGVDLPSNGVVYVNNNTGTCTVGFQYHQTYESLPKACGDVWVSGSYGTDLTIAANNDVVINGPLTRAADKPGVLLGLIANNFVRVYHPVTSDCDDNATGSLHNLTVEAAILALKHSWIVDNWYCGEPLGTITVYGGIAQRFRGTVGQSSGTTPVHGYLKNYEYNDRLRYREPPYFLDPVQASWRIARQNEQVPATGG